MLQCDTAGQVGSGYAPVVARYPAVARTSGTDTPHRSSRKIKALPHPAAAAPPDGSLFVTTRAQPVPPANHARTVCPFNAGSLLGPPLSKLRSRMLPQRAACLAWGVHL